MQENRLWEIRNGMQLCETGLKEKQHGMLMCIDQPQKSKRAQRCYACEGKGVKSQKERAVAGTSRLCWERKGVSVAWCCLWDCNREKTAGFIIFYERW